MQTTHLVGVWTSKQDLLTLNERQDTIVLQQDLTLFCCLKSLCSKLITSELLKALATGIRLCKEVKTIFYSEDTANGIINTAHGHLTLVNQFLQQHAELHAVWVHRHVDTGVDSDTDGIFLILSHLLTGIEVVDISPVGNEHSVPSQILLQPLCEILIAGMNGNSVDRS